MTNAVNGKHRRPYRIFLWMVLFFSVGTICAIMIVDIYRAVPDTIYLKAGEESEISFHVPLSGEIIMTTGGGRRTREVLNDLDGRNASGNTDSIGDDNAGAAGSDAAYTGGLPDVSEADTESVIGRVPVNLAANVTFVANAENSYRAELRLFGIIPFKTVQIEVIDESMVYPAGLPIGIYVKTPSPGDRYK